MKRAPKRKPRIERGSTEHSILALLGALLDTGKTPDEILTALDVVRATLTLTGKGRKDGK